jgi:4'-phosphopantetheinyl transferase
VSGGTIEVGWATAALADVPPDDGWLGPRELGVLERLRFPRRRETWRLGRFAVKRLLGDVEVLPSPEGPPRAFRGDSPLPLSLSLSHRDGVAVCVAAPGDVALGCDVERIEPRSAAFLADFLTESERAAAAVSPELLANLMWSAKESALKALRVGLARDTRELEVSIGEADAPWRELVVDDRAGGRSLPGVWRRAGDHVLTIVSWPARPVPIGAAGRLGPRSGSSG